MAGLLHKGLLMWEMESSNVFYHPKQGATMNSHHANALNSDDPFKTPTGSECSRKPSGQYLLKIWGRFPPDWLGNISSGISKNRISIISGSAKKVDNVWHAEFVLEKTPEASDPGKIDYLALALETPDRATSTAISLDSYLLGEEPGNHDGALYLEVKAPDQLGFLGSLINRFAFYALFPETVIIETVNGMIFDRFWIKGVGGCLPSPMVVDTLRRKLEGFLR
jgi:hypothetical protein